MDDIIKAVGIIIFVVLVFSLFGAVVIKLLWASVIPFIFPGLVEEGYIAGDISLWRSFLLSIFSNVIFKSNTTVNK